MTSKLRLRLAASSLVLLAATMPALAQDAATPAAEPPAAAPGTAAPVPAPAPAAAPAPAPLPPETVIATVGDQPVTEGELASASVDLASQFAQLPAEQRRLAVLSALIDIKALAQEAAAAGLDREPDVAARIAFLRERALHNSYFERNGVAAIDDAALKARYDAEVAAMPPVEEVHAKHILVATKEEAEAAIAELDGGKSFDAVAQERSTDSSAPRGGDLGFFGPGQMVPAFETAAYALTPGTYTKEPVQSQFGWHVISVVEKRPQQPPAFDEVRDQVRQLVMREKYIAMVQAARQELKVAFTDPAVQSQMEAMERAMSGTGQQEPEAAADAASTEADAAAAEDAAGDAPAAGEAAPAPAPAN